MRMLAVAAVAPIGAVADFTVVATVAARSLFEGLVVALSQCAAVATAMAAMGIVEATVRRRLARPLLARLRQGPITAVAAATMLMVTGFAPATNPH
jgi:hypothetical protein